MERTTTQISYAIQPDGIIRIGVNGALDAHSVAEFQEALARAGTEAGSLVLVDLSKTRFIGSAGAGSLLAGSGEIGNTGGRLVVFRPDNPVTAGTRHVFELLGLDHFLEIRTDESDALEYLKATA